MKRVWKRLPQAVQNMFIGAGAIGGLFLIIAMFKFFSFIMVPILLLAIVVLALMGIGTLVRLFIGFVKSEIETYRYRKLLNKPAKERTKTEHDYVINRILEDHNTRTRGRR